ncbi:MAG TPA: DUF2490 domain-containing protein, partial [Puia sp.]
FIKVSKHVTLTPAYLYLGSYGGDRPLLREHGFLNGLILSFPHKQWVVEDRNILWNRFRLHSEDIHFYRNRFRLWLPPAGHSFVIRPYLFDEVFYFINRSRWSRNRIAAGASCDIGRNVNIDISYFQEQDHYNGSTNIVFVMGVFKFLNVKIKRIER